MMLRPSFFEKIECFTERLDGGLKKVSSCTSNICIGNIQSLPCSSQNRNCGMHASKKEMRSLEKGCRNKSLIWWLFRKKREISERLDLVESENLKRGKEMRSLGAWFGGFPQPNQASPSLLQCSSMKRKQCSKNKCQISLIRADSETVRKFWNTSDRWVVICCLVIDPEGSQRKSYEKA